MKNNRLFLITLLMVFFANVAGAASPVKWSAPMEHYPNQWAPAPAPQNYQNYPYGYYPGYGADGSNGQNYQNNYQNYQGFSGNPYYYYGY